MKTYREKLRDPRWQKKRLEIFQRDKWKCQVCGACDLTLHCHHKEYEGDPWEVENEKLITLCEVCHKAEHDKEFEKLKKNTIEDFINVFSNKEIYYLGLLALHIYQVRQEYKLSFSELVLKVIIKFDKILEEENNFG